MTRKSEETEPSGGDLAGHCPTGVSPIGEDGATDQLAPSAKPKAKRIGHALRRHSPLLRVLERVDESPVDWQPRAGLPAGGRDECRNGERPCPYVRCKWHLWLLLGEDRAGRPRDGKRAPTTLLPAWLEDPTPACCGLDVAEVIDPSGAAVKHVAKAMHLGRSRVHDILADAFDKLRGNPDAHHLFLMIANT